MSQTSYGTYFLFKNQTTDTNSNSVNVDYPNKIAVVKVWGTFDGASIKFQTTAPQTASAVWIDVPDINGNIINLTTSSQRVLQYLVQNEQLRAVQSSSGGSTTLNVSLEIC